MDDRTVTWTVLHRDASDAFSRPFVTGMVDAHSYDHAKMLFEEEAPDQFILGIYEGDLNHRDACDRYNEENFG